MDSDMESGITGAQKKPSKFCLPAILNVLGADGVS